MPDQPVKRDPAKHQPANSANTDGQRLTNVKHARALIAFLAAEADEPTWETGRPLTQDDN